MTGDRVLCSAQSDELKGHGLTAGLTNYPAAYCTGFMLARRLLKQIGLHDLYKANEKINGDYFNVDEDVDEDKRPFKALLDVGINRTTTGARVFGAMKGAADGGINVPHSTKRFPGYKRAKTEEITNKRGKSTGATKTEAKYDSKVHRGHIFGNHITTYMNQLKKEDPQKFDRQFSRWEKCLTANKAKTCEDLYKKIHKAILANPDRKKKDGNKKPTKKVIKDGPQRVFADSKGRKWLREFKLTRAERKENV